MESSDSSELSFDELSETESDLHDDEYVIKDLENQLNHQKNINDYLNSENVTLHNSLGTQRLFNLVLVIYSTVLTLLCFK
jgi:hypothetical protein